MTNDGPSLTVGTFINKYLRTIRFNFSARRWWASVNTNTHTEKEPVEIEIILIMGEEGIVFEFEYYWEKLITFSHSSLVSRVQRPVQRVRVICVVGIFPFITIWCNLFARKGGKNTTKIRRFVPAKPATMPGRSGDDDDTNLLYTVKLEQLQS